MQTAVCKSQLGEGNRVSSIDYSYYLLNPRLSLQSQGHTECNKLHKKGAKFIDMFIYVFMATKSFPINERVNDYIIKSGVPNCLLD